MGQRHTWSEYHYWLARLAEAEVRARCLERAAEANERWAYWAERDGNLAEAKNLRQMAERDRSEARSAWRVALEAGHRKDAARNAGYVRSRWGWSAYTIHPMDWFKTTVAYTVTWKRAMYYCLPVPTGQKVYRLPRAGYDYAKRQAEAAR